MPLPVIAGIPFLAGLIGGSLTSLATFIATFIGKRFALAVAMVSLIVAATVAFIALLSGLMTAVEYAAPAQIGIAMGLFLPSNFKLCLSTAITAKIAAWAYSWNVKIIQYKFDF